MGNIGISTANFNRVMQTIADGWKEATLAKRIIEVHGGRIWVESEETGKEVCFASLSPSRNKFL